jgi:hypothetical protein
MGVWRQKTNEVTWDVPKMLAWKKMSSERIFYYNRVTGAPSPPRPPLSTHSHVSLRIRGGSGSRPA